MSEMIERCMRAASAYADTLPEASRDAPFIRSHRAGLVKAIIAAMREASPAMWGAGNHKLHVETEEIGQIWRAMIDEALK